MTITGLDQLIFKQSDPKGKMFEQKEGNQDHPNRKIWKQSFWNGPSLGNYLVTLNRVFYTISVFLFELMGSPRTNSCPHFLLFTGISGVYFTGTQSI